MVSLERLQLLLKNKKFLVLATLLLIALIGLIIAIFQIYKKPIVPVSFERLEDVPHPEVKVIRAEPLPDQKGVSLAPTIKITFEKSISGKKIEIGSSPKVEFDEQLSSGGFNLVLTPKTSLTPSTEYNLAVLADGVKIYTWVFTTGTKGANPAGLEAVKAKLPYYGNHFNISYVAATDKFFVAIDAKPVDTYKKAALAWFASQGLPNAESAANIVYFLTGEAAD